MKSIGIAKQQDDKRCSGRAKSELNRNAKQTQRQSDEVNRIGIE